MFFFSNLFVRYASALIYPSRWEGFGLPILEAFHFECPVICCEMAGAVPEIAKNGAWWVDYSVCIKLIVQLGISELIVLMSFVVL